MIENKLIKYIEIHDDTWQSITIPMNTNNVYLYNINEDENSIAHYDYKDDALKDNGSIKYAEKREFIDMINRNPSLLVKGDVYIELVK